jgi:hypothetical protein
MYRCRVLGIANPGLEADPDHQDPGHDHGIEGETVTGKIDRRGAKGERAHTGMSNCYVFFNPGNVYSIESRILPRWFLFDF